MTKTAIVELTEQDMEDLIYACDFTLQEQSWGNNPQEQRLQWLSGMLQAKLVNRRTDQ